MLAEVQRLLVPGGTLVVGFFDSDDGVGPFDHRVTTAFRWPAEVFAERLTAAGFHELERRQRTAPERPDRRYAAIAARAT